MLPGDQSKDQGEYFDMNVCIMHKTHCNGYKMSNMKNAHDTCIDKNIEKKTFYYLN